MIIENSSDEGNGKKSRRNRVIGTDESIQVTTEPDQNVTSPSGTNLVASLENASFENKEPGDAYNSNQNIVILDLQQDINKQLAEFLKNKNQRK